MTEENKAAQPASAPASAPAAAAHSSPRPEGRPPFRRRPESRRKVCKLCADKVDKVNYKDAHLLKSFTMESGKMISRRITGACARHQRQITRAIKRNRNLAILPYSAD